MKIKNKTLRVSIAFIILLAGCSSYGGKYPQKYPGIEEESKKDTVQPTPVQTGAAPQPPSKFEDEEGYQIRPIEIEIEAGRPYLPVGAEIVTKEGNVPLSRVIRQLADLKGFSVSWAHDVRQTRLVSVNISPADNFWDALDNVLRPLDYFYDTEQNTIVVQYKEAKRYYLPMPSARGAMAEICTSRS